MDKYDKWSACIEKWNLLSHGIDDFPDHIEDLFGSCGLCEVAPKNTNWAGRPDTLCTNCPLALADKSCNVDGSLWKRWHFASGDEKIILAIEMRNLLMDLMVGEFI